MPIASPPPAVCAAEALSLRVARARSTGQRNAFGDPDGFVTDFAVTNHSAGTCRLQGWPTMVLRGNSSLRACVPGLPHDRCGPNDRKDRIDRPGPARMGSDPPVVLIKPGGHTSFSVAWRGVICLEPPYRATVRLPGTTSDLGVRFRYDVAPCLFDANDGRETVHITPLGILAHPS